MKISEKDRRALRIIAIAGLLMILAGLGVLIYVISQPCTLTVSPGCGIPKVILTTDHSWVNSPTSVTVALRNTGLQSTVLSSYYVRDSAGHVYADPGWTGPTIQSNSVVNVTFTIDGKDFTFQSNSNYVVSLHTSQGYVFDFSVLG